MSYYYAKRNGITLYQTTWPQAMKRWLNTYGHRAYHLSTYYRNNDPHYVTILHLED